jgi:hypothetical protein
MALALGFLWAGQTAAAATESHFTFPVIPLKPTSGAVVPYQYIAKAYSEILGRAPSAMSWDRATNEFRQQGCSRASLQQLGREVIASSEYADDYPRRQRAAIAETLYRFVLNRDPSANEFVAARLALAHKSPWQVALALYSSTEFTSITEPAICNPKNPSYSFGEPGFPNKFPAIQTPASGAPGPDTSEASLASKLFYFAEAGGGTYDLSPRQVVGLTTTLTVPGNVTLSTTGSPDPNRYAQMARLVRLPSYSGASLILLLPGSKLEHIWVDGQRNATDPNGFPVFNIRMLGGPGTTVQDDRIGNTYGASNLEDDSADSGVGGAAPCSNNVVSNNLVDGYSSAHVIPAGQPDTDHPEADGFGIYCQHTQVEHNTFLDISDAAIALFTGSAFMATLSPQLSQVIDNTIISAGNSAYWGIVLDPAYSLAMGPFPGGDPAGTTSRQYTKGSATALIADNTLWSGARTHFDVALASGTHALFGSIFHQNCKLPNAGGVGMCGGGRNARGGEWRDNSSDGQLIEVEMGIYVGGTEDATFIHNRFSDLKEVTGGGCPKHAVVVVTGFSAATDFASGLRIDRPAWDDTFAASDECVLPTY